MKNYLKQPIQTFLLFLIYSNIFKILTFCMFGDGYACAAGKCRYLLCCLTGLEILNIVKLCRLSYGVVWSKDYKVLLVVIVLFF